MARLQGRWILLAPRKGVTVNSEQELRIVWGPCKVDLGHVPKDFMDQIRGFHDLLRQKPPSLLIL
jgi:hypothetical protein